MEREYFKPGNMLYPVPAVMVSVKRPDEKPNIITIAWAGTVCSDPAMVSISVRKSRYSYDIIKETGEFVINLVNRDLVYACDYCGVKSGRDVDKFREMNLHEQPSREVGVPGIEESPVNIECRVEQVVALGSHDMFIARVVAVGVNKKYMDATGRFHLNSTGLVAYSHGEYYELGNLLGKFGYSIAKEKTKKKLETIKASETKERLDRQFDFIREIDKEKFIGRQTYLTDGVRKENDSEHAWHMAIMAYLLKEYANENVNVEKTMMMLLVHDLVEIDAGDTYAYDEEGKKTQRQREEKAADRIFGLLPDDQNQIIRELWEEFEKWETPEAKFAHTMDNLQPMMLNASTKGKAWEEHDVVVEQVLRRNEKSSMGSQTLWEYAYENFLVPYFGKLDK